MPLDAPVIANLVLELKRILPVKIDKIFQPYPDEFLFTCFGSGVSGKILISLHPQFARITLFDGERDNPPRVSAFCILLRKHFAGSKLIAIDAVPFERICRLTFEVYSQYQGLSNEYLWVELTGKSPNLIVTTSAEIIIDAWRKTGSKQTTGREITTGAKYEFPGTGGRWKPVSISWEQFYDLITNIPAEVPLEKFLLKHWYGLSALTIHEISKSVGLQPAVLCGKIPETALTKLYACFTGWSEAVSQERFEPSCLYAENGTACDCSAFDIQYPPDRYIVQKINNLNRIVSEIMERNLESNRFGALQNNLRHQINHRLDKALHKLAKQKAEAEAADQGDFYRIAGELLTTYGTQIKKGAGAVKLSNHYDPLNAEIVIPINPALTARDNAQVYFKKYQKAKKGRQAIAFQINKTTDTIEYLESVAAFIQNAQNYTDLKLIQAELENETEIQTAKNRPDKSRKEPVAEPRRFVTPEGDLILVGRNNLQNDRLTFKIAGPGDLWFHTQKIPGSHVILKLKSGNSLTNPALNHACQLAVYFSKAQQSTKVPVDYTLRKNVKKPPGSKPGFVIYDDFKTAIITPDPELLRSLELKV